MTTLPVKTALANAMMVQDSARACSDKGLYDALVTRTSLQK